MPISGTRACAQELGRCPSMSACAADQSIFPGRNVIKNEIFFRPGASAAMAATATRSCASW